MTERTPYDTGAVLQPHIWGDTPLDEPGDWGKVDFDGDAGETVAIVSSERVNGQYVLSVYDFNTGETYRIPLGEQEDF